MQEQKKVYFLWHNHQPLHHRSDGGLGERLRRILAVDLGPGLEHVVGRDRKRWKRDVGRRQLLNLGHTFGHAIERLSGYACSHGHAVAVGMVYAARIAVRLGICPAECVSRLTAALTNHALPTAAPYSAAELAQAARGDKKRLGGNLTLVLPRGIGECELHPVRVAELETLAAYALEA